MLYFYKIKKCLNNSCEVGGNLYYSVLCCCKSALRKKTFVFISFSERKRLNKKCLIYQCEIEVLKNVVESIKNIKHEKKYMRSQEWVRFFLFYYWLSHPTTGSSSR